MPNFSHIGEDVERDLNFSDQVYVYGIVTKKEVKGVMRMMLKRTLLLIAISTLALTGCKSSGQTNGNVTVSESPIPTAVASSEPTATTTIPGAEPSTVPVKGSDGASQTRMKSI